MLGEGSAAIPQTSVLGGVEHRTSNIEGLIRFIRSKLTNARVAPTELERWGVIRLSTCRAYGASIARSDCINRMKSAVGDNIPRSMFDVGCSMFSSAQRPLLPDHSPLKQKPGTTPGFAK